MKDLTSALIMALVTMTATIAYAQWFLSRNIEENVTSSEPTSITQEFSTNNSSSGLTLDDLSDGCPVRDCIPSIDNPVFESAQEANMWLEDDDLIFGINIDGVTRAYPQRVLNWHEIVNDNINDKPVAVTFCPLCGSAISFERVVNGVEAEFGVSGKLFNSNLVMYDRNEESLWQQETGEAIIGSAADRGESLTPIPMSSSFWSDWLQSHPNTEVLSRDTGYSRNYDLYPYGTYEEDGQLYFGIQNTDTRLPLKEPGYGFEINGSHKFYPENTLDPGTSFEDIINGDRVQVNVSPDNIVTIEFQGQTIVPIRTFWFAFAAFHPDTAIYSI